jgi:RNA polymerase sigma factor (sigma-70 family)
LVPSEERRQRFEAIYACHHDPVLAYLLRRARNSDDAADALAETFLAAWRRLDDMPDEERARLWLFGVARQVLANQRRGEQRRSALSARLRDELTEAAVLTGRRDWSPAVSAAFDSLPEHDRELLGLAAWEGLNPGEIAVTLGCSRNAARIRLHRARQRFARELERRDETRLAYMASA